ncbi:MAG: hypothetical protein ABSE28_21690 [Candidatus Sulfotelmatobacter sp.]|jgi:hypothetical protein
MNTSQPYGDVLVWISSLTMKNPYQVLEQKKTDIERVRREIEALHLVIPLLAEAPDWIESGLPLPVRQFPETGSAAAKLARPSGRPPAG